MITAAWANPSRRNVHALGLEMKEQVQSRGLQRSSFAPGDISGDNAFGFHSGREGARGISWVEARVAYRPPLQPGSPQGRYI